MNKEDVIFLMEQVECLDHLDSRDLSEVEEMIKTPAFSKLMGIMLGVKQAHLMALANIGLGTADKSCQASVLQGKVQGIDLVRHTVVDLFTPAGKDS